MVVAIVVIAAIAAAFCSTGNHQTAWNQTSAHATKASSTTYPQRPVRAPPLQQARHPV